jgi:hypothetical protein
MSRRPIDSRSARADRGAPGRRPRPATLAALAAILAAAPVPGAAAFEQPVPDGLSLEVVGACPEAAVVRRLLGDFVSLDEARRATVAIQDQGRNFRIAVGGVATTIDDPARDCTRRARQAAVVAASALQDREVVLGPPVWTVEKGLVIEMAPGANASWAYGAEMRGAYGSGPWSLFGAAGARGPVTLTLDQGWVAELLRLPLDAGYRLTSHRHRLRPWLGLGASVTGTRLVGRNLLEMEPAWRLELGALAMAGATLPVTGRMGVAAALAIRWAPRAYRLQVVPTGTVGETPRWWFGLSLNYTIDGAKSSP